MVGRLRRFNYLAPWGLITLGVGLAVAAAVIYSRQQQTAPRPPADAATSRAAPSSTKPSAKAVASYVVPPGSPKYLTIPAIGLEQARVIKLGLTKSGAIAVPGNLYDTGWYGASAEPGQPGTMFVYGHVSSWTADGVFYNLKKLKPGDAIIITRGDDKKFTYQVVTSKIYPADNVNMNQVLAPVDPAKPGLNLMTCTGQVIKGTSEFNERLVVFASLVE